MKLSDYAKPPVEIWPEHLEVVRIFVRLDTQWRIGMAGPIGLDYTAAYPLIDRATTTSQEWSEMLDDLRVLEAEALDTMREQRD